jgi:Tfp pilus assembly protein PilN
MSQQINLLNPALIERTELLNPNRIVALLGIFFVSLFGYYFYESNELTALKQQRAEAASKLEQLQSDVNSLIAKNKPIENTALLEQINQLEQKEMEQEAIIKATTKTNLHHTRSYAALLRAFSKQSIDGLWITGLTIDQDAQNLSISGRTLDADLVPKYISRLRAEPALKGKTFTDLTMHAVEKKSAPNSAQASPNLNNVQELLAMAMKTQKVAVAIKAEKKPKYEMPDYIEFTLKSVADKKSEISAVKKVLHQITAGVTN